MKSLIFAILYIVAYNLSGQNRDAIWPLCGTFPDRQATLDFRNGTPPDTSTLISTLGFYLTNASICDTSGNLLFYTNGQLVYNRFHQPMMNSGNFNPGAATNYNYPYGLETVKAVVILPHPDSTELYDIFHISGEFFTAYNVGQLQPLNLMHSVVDMRLDSGRGAITQIKNEIIISDTLSHGGMTSVKHANGRDWWIMIHGFYNSLFYKALLTPAEIIIYSEIEGLQIVNDAFSAQLILNPLGDKCALLHYPYYDIYDFDRCTGDLNFRERILSSDTPYSNLGVAFSPNGRYLYGCSNLNILQYDTYAGNIAATCDTVAQWDTSYAPLATTFFMMQLAPDNKIYVSTYQGTNVLHVINNPDLPGDSCNVVQKGLVLPWYNAFSMPNHTNYELGPIDGSVCDSLGLNNVGIFSFSNEASNVVVFPNPSPSYFNFMIKDDVVKSIEVFNYIGEKVASSGIANVNLASQSSGVYFYKIITRKGALYNGKLIKN